MIKSEAKKIFEGKYTKKCKIFDIEPVKFKRFYNVFMVTREKLMESKKEGTTRPYVAVDIDGVFSMFVEDRGDNRIWVDIWTKDELKFNIGDKNG